MTTRTGSKLGAALRARFPGGPRQALRALGLDESVLSATPPSNNTDATKRMRVELEQVLAEHIDDEQAISKILGVLDRHAPFDRVADDDPNAEKVRELAGDDETEEERREKLMSFLREKGMSEDDCAKAADAAWPANNFSMGGAGRGSQLMAGDAALRRKYPEVARLLPTLPPQRPEPRMAADSRAMVPSRKFNERYPGIDRIRVG